MSPAREDPSAPLIVVNPRAARLHDPGRRAAIVGGIVHAVRARTGMEPRIEDGDLEATRHTLAGMASPPLVVAVGGDGTIREAAAAIAGRPIPLAIVPAGTGNVLAGTLGIRGIGPAEAAIRHGDEGMIDLGEATWGAVGVPTPVGRSIFLVACGMGLDARIMAAAEHEWKRRIQFGAYVGAAIRELTRLATADFSIVADGQPLEMRGYLALIANAGDLVPGRIGPRERIDPTDGWLDLLIMGGADPFAGLRGATELLLRKGDLEGRVIRRPVRTVRIEAEPAQPIETDGDARAPGWLEASVLPAALTVLSPAR